MANFSSSGVLLLLYTFYAGIGLAGVNNELVSTQSADAFTFGLGVLTLSIFLLTLWAREIFGRDLMGFSTLSNGWVRGVVFLLSSGKFVLMGGLIWWGLVGLNLSPLALSVGAVWALVAFTLAALTHWFFARRAGNKSLTV